MSPLQPPEAFVRNYLILIPSQSFSEFQKVLDIIVRVRSDGAL